MAEWTLDSDDAPPGVPLREGDGFDPWPLGGHMGTRGGSFFGPAELARASARTGRPPDFVHYSLGVRPARAIE